MERCWNEAGRAVPWSFACFREGSNSYCCKVITENAIMRAIMDKAGVDSKAGTIVFSLPVTSTAGLRILEDSQDEEVDDENNN